MKTTESSSEMVNHQSSPVYRTTVVRRTGGAYAHLHEIVTDGSEFLALEDREWAVMTCTERAEFDVWLQEYHEAEVAIAESEPRVRERLDTLLGTRNGDIGGDVLLALLERARNEVGTAAPNR